MPAGKIYVPKSVRRNRRRRRASNFKKAVRSIARKAIMTEAETKTGVLGWSTAFGTNGTLLGIWSSVGQGTAQQNREGDEIRSLGIKMRGYVSQDPSTITAMQDANSVRMMIFTGKRPLTLTDVPNWQGAVDPETITVLQDFYVNFSTTKRYLYIQKYVKFNRKVKYALSAVNKNELYIACVGFGGTGMTATAGNFINVQIQQYFKDI